MEQVVAFLKPKRKWKINGNFQNDSLLSQSNPYYTELCVSKDLKQAIQ